MGNISDPVFEQLMAELEQLEDSPAGQADRIHQVLIDLDEIQLFIRRA